MKRIMIAVLMLVALASVAEAGGYAFRARLATGGCASGLCGASVQQFQSVQSYAAPVQIVQQRVQTFQSYAAPVQALDTGCYGESALRFQSFNTGYSGYGLGVRGFGVGGFRQRAFFGSPFGGVAVRAPGFRLRIR